MSAWGYPPSRPFLLLSIYFAISVLQISAVAARPPFPDTPVRALWTLAGVSVVLLLWVAAAWFLHASAALPVIVGLGMLVAAAATAVSVGGQGQLISGFYLAVLGMYSGYFLSPRAVRVLVVIAAVAYGSALVVSWRLDSPAYMIAVVVLIVGVTLVVSSLVQRLKGEATHDPLTGLLNRRALGERADALHALDARREGRTAIVLVDLDGFKEFNDAHGHEAGDRLLVELAHDWSGVLRRTDLLARTGGDEFVLVLPATDASEADLLIERMRAAHDFTWSVGAVQWLPGESFASAVMRADTEMYRDKARTRHQGRDLNQRP